MISAIFRRVILSHACLPIPALPPVEGHYLPPLWGFAQATGHLTQPAINGEIHLFNVENRPFMAKHRHSWRILSLGFRLNKWSGGSGRTEPRRSMAMATGMRIVGTARMAAMGIETSS